MPPVKVEAGRRTLRLAIRGGRGCRLLTFCTTNVYLRLMAAQSISVDFVLVNLAAATRLPLLSKKHSSAKISAVDLGACIVSRLVQRYLAAGQGYLWACGNTAFATHQTPFQVQQGRLRALLEGKFCSLAMRALGIKLKAQAQI